LIVSICNQTAVLCIDAHLPGAVTLMLTLTKKSLNFTQKSRCSTAKLQFPITNSLI